MQDFPIVAMLDSEANLGEPVEDHIFGKILSPLLALRSLLFDFGGEIASICIIHDDAQLSFLGFVDFSEMNDIRVIEHLQDLGFLDGILLFLLRHARNIYFLDYSITLNK